MTTKKDTLKLIEQAKKMIEEEWNKMDRNSKERTYGRIGRLWLYDED